MKFIFVMPLLFIVNVLSQNIPFSLIRDNGPSNNRISIAIMAEGYTANQQDRFNQNVDTLLQRMLAFTPFKQYQRFFNFYRFNTISQDSGLDTYNGSFITLVNTYFDASLNIPSNSLHPGNAYKALQLASDSIPRSDMVLILANYGYSAGAGGGSLCIIDNSSDVEYSALHEFGHVLGGLDDEYQPMPSALAPNITKDTIRDSVKWINWIPLTAELPTPIYERYVGANPIYGYPGFFKPEGACMMSSASSPFCRICTEALVLEINRRTKAFDAYYPSFGTVGYIDSLDTFSISMVDTANLKYGVKWYLDDTAIPGANAFTFVLDPIQRNLGSSTHTLKCRFRDTTWYKYGNRGQDSIDYCPFVRTDPDSVMTDSVVWTLQYGIGIENGLLAMASTEPTLSVFTSGSLIRIHAAPFGNYQLGVYDIRGRLIKEFGQGIALRAMEHTFRPQTAGMYFVRLIAKGKVLSRKAVGM